MKKKYQLKPDYEKVTTETKLRTERGTYYYITYFKTKEGIFNTIFGCSITYLN